MAKPVIAAVNGAAAGAGAGLAFACDLRIAARSASFSMAFADVGLGADTGASYPAAAADRPRPGVEDDAARREGRTPRRRCGSGWSTTWSTTRNWPAHVAALAARLARRSDPGIRQHQGRPAPRRQPRPGVDAGLRGPRADRLLQLARPSRGDHCVRPEAAAGVRRRIVDDVASGRRASGCRGRPAVAAVRTGRTRSGGGGSGGRTSNRGTRTVGRAHLSDDSGECRLLSAARVPLSVMRFP